MIKLLIILLFADFLTPVQIINKYYDPHINNVISFYENSSNIRFEDCAELNSIASYINTDQGYFINSTTVETMKFNVLIRGYGDNEQIAQERAMHIYEYLVNQGVSIDRLIFPFSIDIIDKLEVVRFIVVIEKSNDEKKLF